MKNNISKHVIFLSLAAAVVPLATAFAQRLELGEKISMYDPNRISEDKVTAIGSSYATSLCYDFYNTRKKQTPLKDVFKSAEQVEKTKVEKQAETKGVPYLTSRETTLYYPAFYTNATGDLEKKFTNDPYPLLKKLSA